MSLSRFSRRALACALSLAATVALTGSALAEGEVNIYSYREPKLIEPLLKGFTDKTGIKTNVVFASAGLIERIAAEGKNSPADVMLSNEFGLLTEAVKAGITQAITSSALAAAIPAEYRDPANHWFGLTRRARVVYAAKDRVKQDAITWEELADPKWRGKICIRSGQHTYNVALVASMIANVGAEKAEAWLSGVKANLARKPGGGDREAVRDVAAGQCDIAIGNTYYMAAMLNNPEQKAWAEAVKIIFPNTEGRGAHVNITGAVVAANAPHKDNAVALIEYLASEAAQKTYAEANGEYPVRAGVPVSPLVAGWGPLKPDPLPLAKIGALRKQASELIDKVKFDQGPAS